MTQVTLGGWLGPGLAVVPTQMQGTVLCVRPVFLRGAASAASSLSQNRVQVGIVCLPGSSANPVVSHFPHRQSGCSVTGL